jgi:uncharacterized protein with HEPN domain
MGDGLRRPSPIDGLIGACENMAAFVDGYTENRFYRTTLVWSAVAFQMIVLGEAAKQLGQEVRERYPDIPWKDIIGMRDILSHKYDTIDLEEIWGTVHEDIPRLLANLREIESALRR